MKFTYFRLWSITRRLTFSFVIVILIGSVLLSMPFSHYPNSPEVGYLNHLFTAVSMVCVTGLAVVPVSEAYNGFGQVVSILLMQIGGLGLVTLIAISTYALNRKLDLAGSSLLQSALNHENHHGLKNYLFFAYKITFCIESLAMCLIATDFVPRFGWKNGLFNSLFLAVSAFCNAGFDNFSTNSLKDFIINPTINLVLCGLIISGGIGFTVWKDIFDNLKVSISDKPRYFKSFFRKMSHHTRLVLQTSAIILLVGTLITWFLEKDNPKTLGNYHLLQQLMIAFFQTVTMRTAGFATISYTDALAPTNFLYMFQMIIGGAPGGTAGGIKVTTAAIIFLLFKAEFSGLSKVTYQFRSISNKTIKQTTTVVIFFFTVLFSGFLLLLWVEPEIDSVALLFETVSAIGTVGVSMDITPKLSPIGKIIVIVLMFIGRVGPITFLLSLIKGNEKKVNFAEVKILVG
ncbi:TrkH family potassium uptake protein [Streptococcus hongkongensis]